MHEGMHRMSLPSQGVKGCCTCCQNLQAHRGCAAPAAPSHSPPYLLLARVAECAECFPVAAADCLLEGLGALHQVWFGEHLHKAGGERGEQGLRRQGG